MKKTIVVLAAVLFLMGLSFAVHAEEKNQVCPPLTAFPFQSRILGENPINIGDSITELSVILDKIGTRKTDGDDVSYEVRPKGVVAFDVHSVSLDFHAGRLSRAKIIYQVAPVGTKTNSQLDVEIEKVLGKIEGHIKGPEGRLLRAWKKGSVLISVDYNDVIMWYVVEFFDQGK